jgi:hypothetical protein
MARQIALRGLGLLLLGTLIACPWLAVAEASDAVLAGDWRAHLLAVPPSSAAGEVRGLWLDHAWPFRLKIDVRPESLAGAGELTAIPLLLHLTAANAASVFLNAKPDGSDLVLTGGDGLTILKREVVSYDAATQAAEIWFRAETLSPDDRTFFLYYGNPDTALVAADGQVWKTEYLGVYHFDDDPGLGLLTDYGQHGSHAIPRHGWTSSDTVAGAIGQGWRLNGTTHIIDGDALYSADSSFTISAWFGLWNRPDGSAFAFQSEVDYWHLSAMVNTDNQRPDFSGPGGAVSWHPNPIPDTLLHSFVWTLDGVNDTTRFYFDGEEQEIYTRYVPNPPYKAYTGSPIAGNIGIAGPCWLNGQDHLKGIADEFRVYQGVQTPDWIQTEYRNQATPVGFFTFAEQTSVDVPEPGPGIAALSLLRVFPSPARGPVTIELQLAQPLRGAVQVFDIEGRLLRSLPVAARSAGRLHLLWDGRDADGRGLRGGIYFVRARTGGGLLERRLVVLP